MQEDFYWLAENVYLLLVLALLGLFFTLGLRAEFVILRSWKQALDTKTFYLIPTIAFISSPTAKSLDIFWLWWDFVLKFKKK